LCLNARRGRGSSIGRATPEQEGPSRSIQGIGGSGRRLEPPRSAKPGPRSNDDNLGVPHSAVPTVDVVEKVRMVTNGIVSIHKSLRPPVPRRQVQFEKVDVLQRLVGQAPGRAHEPGPHSPLQIFKGPSHLRQRNHRHNGGQGCWSAAAIDHEDRADVLAVSGSLRVGSIGVGGPRQSHDGQPSSCQAH